MTAASSWAHLLRLCLDLKLSIYCIFKTIYSFAWCHLGCRGDVMHKRSVVHSVRRPNSLFFFCSMDTSSSLAICKRTTPILEIELIHSPAWSCCRSTQAHLGTQIAGRWSLPLSSARRPPPGDYYVLPGLFMWLRSVTPSASTRELNFLRIKAPLLPRGLSGEASEASSWPRSSDSSPYGWMPFRGLDALSVNFQSHIRGRTVSPFKDTWPFNLLQTRNIYITNTSLADGFTLKLCPRRAKKNTGDLFPS